MKTSIDSTGAFMISMLTYIAGLTIGLSTGWVIAQNNIATECERLNAFYVGNKTFICDVK